MSLTVHIGCVHLYIALDQTIRLRFVLFVTLIKYTVFHIVMLIKNGTYTKTPQPVFWH